MLDRPAPVPGTGWGCTICNLPQDGAIAVMCDLCISEGAYPAEVCVGFPEENKRMTIGLLTGIFFHDMDKHVVVKVVDDSYRYN